MMKPKLLILDCDGVLVRSEAANVAYYNKMFSHFGLKEVASGDLSEIALLHTLSTPQVIDSFFRPELKNAALSYAEGLDFMEFEPFLAPEPGWEATLEALRGSMWISVATNRGRSARGVIARVGLSGLVDNVFTVNDVQNPKPAPDILNLALSHYRIAPENAAYVGDSGLDRQAAMLAKVTFIGFRTEGDLRIEEPGALLDMW